MNVAGNYNQYSASDAHPISSLFYDEKCISKRRKHGYAVKAEERRAVIKPEDASDKKEKGFYLDL